MEQKTANRAIQMDLLRIAACIMVIVMHVVADGVYDIDVHSVKWTVLTAYSNLCRGAVPVFFMLSGMFSRSTDCRRALKKAGMYLLIYAAWTAIYRAADVYASHDILETDTRPVFEAFILGLSSHKYHLWFLPAFAVVNLFAPAVNALCEKHPPMISYLAAIFVAGTLGVQTLYMVFDRYPEVIRWLNMLPDCSMGYVGFYVLGRWMHEHRTWLQSKQGFVYALGALSMIGVFAGTCSASRFAGKMSDLFYGHFNLMITLEAAAWIVLLWQFRIPAFLHGVIAWLAGNSLFIYLVHVLIIDIMTWNGIYSYKVHWLLGVPIKTAAVFVVCCCLCALKNAMKKAWRMHRAVR